MGKQSTKKKQRRTSPPVDPPTPQTPPADRSPSKIEKSGDLFVSLGNMSDKTIAHMRAVLERNDPQMMENYENMVEEFIEGFNHGVTQGVPPEWMLFAFTQAYAITLGQCLRAGLPYKEAAKFLRAIIENANLSEKMVKQVSILTEGSTKQ